MTVSSEYITSLGGQASFIVTNDSHRQLFDVRTPLRFENSINGGIAALVLSTIAKYIAYWHSAYGCDHTFIPYQHSMVKHLQIFVPVLVISPHPVGL